MDRNGEPRQPASLDAHRVKGDLASVTVGQVRYAPVKSLWFIGMTAVALFGGLLTVSTVNLLVFVLATGTVLLFGHSLGSHRKLIHDSFQCPKWLEYALVYLGVQVGLAGPLGLLRQHELRDFAQRLPDCHRYLRHGSGFWRDAWWQLHCELRLDDPPRLQIEPRLQDDRFYRFLERTWMLQQLPPAALLYAAGGWGFVIWGVCARITAGVFGHWLIGYFAHNEGAMRFEVRGAAVQGRNIPWTSLLTMGESWHNNHHAFPGSARLGLAAGEWDPGWWMLKLLLRAGLVWNMRLPADLPVRDELVHHDGAAVRPLIAAAPSPLSLRAVWHHVWTVRQPSGNRATLHAPAATASLDALRWIVGARVSYLHAPDQRRLILQLPQSRARGLPALCIAAASRGRVAQALALALAPAAVLFESAREALDAA
jgi:fatty-acid desaturase